MVAGTRTLVFVRSRRGAEAVAASAQRRLDEIDPALVRTVATYRGGYLPEERRELEQRLRSGDLLGLASTNALELGIDVAGLDAIVSVGFPGTRAALQQQLGRAGRAGQESLGVLVARDEPLDTFLVHHPEALLGAPVEASVFDPDNPYVLGPHLAAAAHELPLTADDISLFGPRTMEGIEALEAAGWLRRREAGWFWTRRDRASDLADLRSSGGRPVQIVDGDTGRLVGTVDAGSADSTVHTGAVYVHQGEVYVVDDYDVEGGAAEVHLEDPKYSTQARSTTEISIVETERTQEWGAAAISFGTVDVASQVVSFIMRSNDGSNLGEEPLDLPERTLRTKAVWWTLRGTAVMDALASVDVPGAAHAAEHAAIGMLPLLATCDRWDIGGVSTALHVDTGRLTVFVYDGYPGGAGFAERGHDVAARWLRVTREAIVACECADGCPSCVHSPKCGNGNEPLDKAGAVKLLDAILAGAPQRRLVEVGRGAGVDGEGPPMAPPRRGALPGRDAGDVEIHAASHQAGSVAARHVPCGVAAVVAGQAGPAAGERGEVGSRRDLVLESHDRRDLRHDDGSDAQHRGHPQRVDRDRAALPAPDPTVPGRMGLHGVSSADTADAVSVRAPTWRRIGNGSRDRADTRTVTSPSCSATVTVAPGGA